MGDLWETYEENRSKYPSKHLRLEDEMEKYCCTEYIDDSIADIIKTLKYPDENDAINFENADFFKSKQLKPIVFKGSVVDIFTSGKDGSYHRFLIMKENRNLSDAETLLHLQRCSNLYYSIMVKPANAQRTKYSIGDFHNIRPGKEVVIALTNLRIDPQNDRRILANYQDICDDYNSDLLFLDEQHYIHKTVDYLLNYNELSRRQDKTSSSGGCYIATAVYGTYDCSELWTLRRFRDEILAQNCLGRSFIKFYYAVSPTAVKLFGRKQWFNYFFRNKLDKMVKKLNARGIKNTPYQD